MQWETHNSWQESMAIGMQYKVAEQLGERYVNDSLANIYYVENNMYYIIGKKDVYGAGPITYSTYKDGNPCAWYGGTTLDAAIRK